ncbi:hypothetical protein GGQ68_000161 [Sagittula marina]|uniref:Thiamine pyrophosphate enzyme N-terminal TPP-binding domain-containing protein n=1 Tax=Sagittula marina TaxID=943940 RepID=A0A7W6DNI7_9RHOB|nr:hypothetical protein [Sagittula marina]
MKMTTEDAFVKVLQRHGFEHAFGIIGSAFMAISDLFPQAGIQFRDCAHEGSGGMMADGYTRASGKMSMMIAQNGPGIPNFVTAAKTAYWNHSPLQLVTSQAAHKTIGQGGFFLARCALLVSGETDVRSEHPNAAAQLPNPRKTPTRDSGCFAGARSQDTAHPDLRRTATRDPRP